MDRFTGGCLCGGVRFEAEGRPYRVGLCHCLDCRKHHGALFHASAIFPQDAVTVSGETGCYDGRVFCPRCGSPVFGRSGDEIEVNVGSLDALGLRLAYTCPSRRIGYERPPAVPDARDEAVSLKDAARRSGLSVDTIRRLHKRHGIGRQMTPGSPIEVSFLAVLMLQHGDLDALDMLRGGHRDHPGSE